MLQAMGSLALKNLGQCHLYAGSPLCVISIMDRVTDLAFLKPDFEILAFLEIKKKQTKSGFIWPFLQSKRLGSEKTLSELHIFIANLF